MTRRIADPRKLADDLIAARDAAEKPLAEFANAMYAAQFALDMTPAERKSFECFAFDFGMHNVYVNHVLARLQILGGEQ